MLGKLPICQEIKEAVELPLTHPELYEDIGIKPPKVGGCRAGGCRGRVGGCMGCACSVGSGMRRC